MRSNSFARRETMSNIHWDDYREFILDEFRAGKTSPEIVFLLRENFGIESSRRTVQRQLAKWEERKRSHIVRSEKFISLFIATFFGTVASDEMLAKVCTAHGYPLKPRTARKIRMELNLRKRATAGQPELAEEELHAAVEEQLKNGSIRNYGRELLYTHFRKQGYLVGK